MVVGVPGRTVGGAAERTRSKLRPALISAGTLALVVPDGPVTFVKELLIVAAGALGKGREVEHFGSVVEGGIFPDGWVSSKSTAGVP